MSRRLVLLEKLLSAPQFTEFGKIPVNLSLQLQASLLFVCYVSKAFSLIDNEKNGESSQAAKRFAPVGRQCKVGHAPFLFTTSRQPL